SARLRQRSALQRSLSTQSRRFRACFRLRRRTNQAARLRALRLRLLLLGSYIYLLNDYAGVGITGVAMMSPNVSRWSSEISLKRTNSSTERKATTNSRRD